MFHSPKFGVSQQNENYELSAKFMISCKSLVSKILKTLKDQQPLETTEKSSTTGENCE